MTIDNDFLKEIDSEEKAYILGIIASNGSVSESSVSIHLGTYDTDFLRSIANSIDSEASVFLTGDLVGVTINSKKMSSDVCSHLKITHTLGIDNIKFPDLSSDNLYWNFIRGYFDGKGTISDPALSENDSPICCVFGNSEDFINELSDFVKINHYVNGAILELKFNGNNALDFMANMYSGSGIKMGLARKYNLYLNWASWVSHLFSNQINKESNRFEWSRSREDAVAPSKTRASDSGYDLVILEMVKKVGDVEFYDTGIKISPAYGWYFDLVPRSSITKTGYILANNTGIIDRTYRGSILVPLIKVDKNAKDFVGGERVVQIIPRPIIHIHWKEVKKLDDTHRGDGGFGSTGV